MTVGKTHATNTFRGEINKCIGQNKSSSSETKPKKHSSTKNMPKEHRCNRRSLNKSDSNWECEANLPNSPFGHYLHPLNDKILSPKMRSEFKGSEDNICGRTRKDVKCNKDNVEGCTHYHIDGMLDRDQRSVVNRLRDDVVDSNGVVRHSCCCEWTVITCVKFPCERRTRKSKQRWSCRVAQSKFYGT